MNKEHRNRMLELGYTILRTQYTLKGWCVAKLTDAGGWARYDNEVFTDRNSAQVHLAEIVLCNENFVEDI